MRIPPSTILAAAAIAAACTGRAQPCRIEVVEKGTGWPVPLVELRTTHHLAFVTDNAGVVACDAPELMGRETWFEIRSEGYERPKDGFGYAGVRLTPQPGQSLRVEVTRTMLARRLGRLTGAGIFAESQKLGREQDWVESGVAGCDSVQTVAHRGRLYWIWGDTVLPGYPLGIFDATSATSAVAPLASFEPPVRLILHYFANEKGAPRGVAKMPGPGPTWLTACVSLPDARGTPRLVASYVKVKPPLEVYQRGLCVWNEDTNSFEPLDETWTKAEGAAKPPPWPEGHAVPWRDEQGRSWILFGNPFPTLRCPATFEQWRDRSKWEPLAPPETLTSARDGTPVKPHSGSIAWQAWRRRWVAVFLEQSGQPAAFGELWYAEAATPMGPWGRAVKVLSHRNYTFYNPQLHPEFTPADSPILLFEGTYTAQFARHAEPTPRYDYNQVLYRLDLDDPAFQPAQR